MPATPLNTREYSIVYGAVTVGAGTVYHIDRTPGAIVWNITPTEASVSFFVTILGASSAADLETACDSLEAEFAKRFLRFRLLFDGTTVIDWNPASGTNSGFLAQPRIERIDHPAQTGRSRVYRCSVSVQLPADDNTGRRWASIELAIGAGGQKVVTITGQYTAQAAGGARANYEAKIGTFASAVLTSLGGTYNKPQETATADDQDKLLDFRLVYEEIVFTETADGNVASIVKHEVTFALNNVGPGDTAGGPFGQAYRLKDVSATYFAIVDKRQTTDLATLWQNTMFPYILAQAQAAYPGGCAIVSEDPRYEKQGNVVTASIRLLISTKGGLLEYAAEQEVRELPGMILVPVWNKNRYAKRVYQGPADTFRTTTVVARSKGTAALGVVQGVAYAAASAQRSGRGAESPKSGWILVENVKGIAPITLGLPEYSRLLDTWTQRLRIVEQWAEAPTGGGTVQTGGGGGGGGGSRTAPTTPGGSAGRAITGGGGSSGASMAPSTLVRG